VPATCILPAIVWAGLNWDVMKGFVSFAGLGDLSNFAPPQTVSTPGLQRLAIVGESSHALLLGLLVLIALAGVGFLRTIRRPQTWGFMISAGVGLVLISVNPYGNEGIFRVALFGIPWLALVAMEAVPDNPPRWVSAAFGAVAVGLLGTFLVSMFGLDNENVIRPADLQALQALEAQAPPNTYVLNLAYGDIPVSVTFPQLGDAVQWTSLVTAASAQPDRPDAADAVALARDYIRYAGTARNLYAIWSPASVANSVDYGLETQAHALEWRKLLAASPDWQVVFNRDGTYLFRVVVPAGT